MKKKLLFIGWDAADWKIMGPLLQSGQMPNLSGLMERGAVAEIQTLQPPVSPMLWTSIATGKRAWQHGITNFFEQIPGEKGFVPVLGSSRKVKAIWNILSEMNLCSNVVGWWPSHPAEPINGCMVSDYFVNRSEDNIRQVLSVKGGVYPEVHEQFIADLAFAPESLPLVWMQRFFPHYLSAEQAQQIKMDKSRKVIANMLTTFEISKWLIQLNDWNFHAVYFDAIDKFCHMFMRFQSPQQPFVSDEDFLMFKDAVDVMYRIQDNMLGEYLKLAGDDTTVILMSDHGFRSGNDRLEKLPDVLFRPVGDHRDTGVFVISGPSIRSGTRLNGISLLDVCPTILYALDVPVANDMSGRVILEAFSDQRVVKRIDTWESGERNITPSFAGMENAGTMLKQLEDLGYISLRGTASEQQQRMLQESNYVTAMSLQDDHKYPEAFDLFTGLVSENEKELRFLAGLFYSSIAVKRFEIAEETIELMRAADASERNVFFMEVRLLVVQRKFPKALKLLEMKRDLYGRYPEFNLMLSRCCFQMGRLEDAISAAVKAVAANEDDPDGYFLLSGISFRKKHWDAVLGYGLEAIHNGCRYPQIHLMMGRAAKFSERYELAASAFEQALYHFPNNRNVRSMLISVYQDNLQQPEAALPHQQYLDEQPFPQVVVVSGVPRSGTSMMMQALNAGGMQVLTDGIRTADEHNPNGYLEYEKVKYIGADKSWMNDAAGKAVKVVANLLSMLPSGYQYKVILMERNLPSVMLSQQKMLNSEGKDSGARAYRVILQEQQLRVMEKAFALKEKSNFEILKLKYEEVIEAPYSQMMRVQEFLDVDLDIDLMAASIDPSLNRNGPPSEEIS